MANIWNHWESWNNWSSSNLKASIKKQRGLDYDLESIKIENCFKKTKYKWPFQIVEKTSNDVFTILLSWLDEKGVVKKWREFINDEDFNMKEMFVRSSCWVDIIKWNRLQKIWNNIKKEDLPKEEFLYDKSWIKTHKLNKLYNTYRPIEDAA